MNSLQENKNVLYDIEYAFLAKVILNAVRVDSY